MNTVYLSALDEKEALFHFTNLSNVQNIIETGGLVSKIGDNSLGIEEKEKIFFSKGYIGMLELIDVWLKWEMTRYFGWRNIAGKKNDDYIKWNSFYEDWYSGSYKEKDYYLNILFNNLYEDFINRRYFSLSLDIDEDYNPNLYDDVKVRMSKSEDLKSQLYLIYGDYSNIDDFKMESWNMFTYPNAFIPIEKMSMISTSDDKFDALSIITEVYDKVNKSDISFYLLDKFIDYSKKRKQSETKKLRLNI